MKQILLFYANASCEHSVYLKMLNKCVRMMHNILISSVFDFFSVLMTIAAG